MTGMPHRAGVEYVFTVTVSKGSDGGAAWSHYRSDNASCFVSTSALDTPLVSIIPKVSFPAQCLIKNSSCMLSNAHPFHPEGSKARG